MDPEDVVEETFADFQPKKVLDLKEGAVIDRYQILGLVGKGGMGAVYKAYDPELDRSIAIKILTAVPQEGETASRPQARLMREAQALAKLSHPHVVAVHDVGTYAEGVYIAMEYVKGKTIREWLKQDTPNQKEIIGVLSKAGKGLVAAHTEGIVHRDFKPDNVIVGEKGQIKVLDFGVARAAGKEDMAVSQQKASVLDRSLPGEKYLSTPLTQAGSMVGTTVYMAPEHFSFQALDEKTDQFSFCVTLFESLYGKRPFTGNTAQALKEKIENGRVEIPGDANVPKWIEEIILKGLSVSKEDRYRSMWELLQALEHDPEIAKSQRRKKQLLAATFVVSAVAFLGIGYVLFGQSHKLCTGADRKIDSVWSNTKKAHVKEAFVKTGISYANDSFIRVARRLEQYLQNWKTDYWEACRATRVRKEQSEEMLDLKMGCMNRHFQNAAALIRVFGKADKTVVQKSVQAVSSLSGFSNCNDVDALQAKIPPPKDDQTKTKVDAIREHLAEIEALVNTGKYRDGLDQLIEVEKRAKTIDYLPVHAQALYHLGEIYERVGEYKMAETALKSAVKAAGKSKDTLLVAKTMVLLVWVIGYQQSRHEEGLLLSEAAEAVLDLGPANVPIRSSLHNRLGGLYFGTGNPSQSMENFQKALKLRSGYLSREHPSIALILNNIGAVYWARGEYDKALEYYLETLAIQTKTLGPRHPVVGSLLCNIGGVYKLNREYDKALDYYNDSLAIREETLGPIHPDVAFSLSSIGDLLVEQGKPKKALTYLERAIAICEKMTCDPDPYGHGLLGLAQALMATGGDKKRAILLAKRAQRLFEKSPKRFAKALENIDSWLRENETVSLTSR